MIARRLGVNPFGNSRLARWLTGRRPHIPNQARGGSVVTSGLMIVGEPGPELYNIPAGANLYLPPDYPKRLIDANNRALQDILEGAALFCYNAPEALPLAPSGPKPPAVIDCMPIPPDPTPEAIPIIWANEAEWLYFDLDKGSWLVAGISGGGKGNFVSWVILNLLRRGPERIKVTILDMKAGLDYYWADDLEHSALYEGHNVTAGLTYLLADMDSRNRIMRKARCKNIKIYNARFPDRALPYAVVVIDEGAELDTGQRKQAATLARMGRAAGYRIIYITQYPTTEAIPSQVRANLHNKISFKLDSPQHAPIALGRATGDISDPNPAYFTREGECVYKAEGGIERTGRVPELTPDRELAILDDLYVLFGKGEGVTSEEGQTAAGSLGITPAELALLQSINEQDSLAERTEPPPKCKRCGTYTNLRKVRNGDSMCRDCFGKKV